MTLLIVLNDKKEPYFLIGMLLFFITNDNLPFRFLNNGSLDNLVVTRNN
jgi:hypothetical protein